MVGTRIRWKYYQDKPTDYYFSIYDNIRPLACGVHHTQGSTEWYIWKQPTCLLFQCTSKLSACVQLNNKYSCESDLDPEEMLSD